MTSVYFKEDVAIKIFNDLPGIRVHVFPGKTKHYTSPNLQDTLDFLEDKDIVFTTTRLDKFKWEAKSGKIIVTGRTKSDALIKGIEKLYEENHEQQN